VHHVIHYEERSSSSSPVYTFKFSRPLQNIST